MPTGKQYLGDASVVVNNVDLSDHVASVTINESQPEVDVTAMGDGGHVILPGLPDCTIEVTYRQDYTSGKVDGTHWTLYNMTSGFQVVVKPTSPAVGASNPTFTATCVLLDYQPISGGPGDAADATVTYTVTGTIVRATS